MGSETLQFTLQLLDQTLPTELLYGGGYRNEITYFYVGTKIVMPIDN